jgi:hypothetical protein
MTKNICGLYSRLRLNIQVNKEIFEPNDHCDTKTTEQKQKYISITEPFNSPSVAHVGYDISPLSRVKLKILTTRRTACG